MLTTNRMTALQTGCNQGIKGIKYNGCEKGIKDRIKAGQNNIVFRSVHDIAYSIPLNDTLRRCPPCVKECLLHMLPIL